MLRTEGMLSPNFPAPTNPYIFLILTEVSGPIIAEINGIVKDGEVSKGYAQAIPLHLSFNPELGARKRHELLPSRPGRMRPIRIVAQENPATDSEGYLWAADKYFSGGNTVNRLRPILNSPEPLYEGERYGNFSYRIPLAPGKYRLTLHFAETWFGTPEAGWPALDSRIFNVFANGVSLLRNYQIIHDTGQPNLSIAKAFDGLEPNAQGMLVIDFVPVKNYAEVNAIEVQETE